MSTPSPINADALRSVMAWWEDSGVDVPVVKPAKRVLQKTASRTSANNNPRKTASKPAAVKAAIPADDKTAKLIESVAAIAGAAPTLDALKIAIETLDTGDLYANATRAVFARGNPEADIMVIGEAPGRDEDEMGMPFVGASGHLLDKMLAAIGLDESSVYITNVCNWRPLNNRTPNPQEIELCRPFIKRHIELAKPKIIVLTGGVSLEILIGIKGIMKTRGQWQNYEIDGAGLVPALPLYHPAFLLKRPELKREAWHDLLALKARISEA